ncbi:hypothetical protein [Nocardioides bruguierae]|uniref:Uncharacterized protein n=1 Tax=Nocardioides bruguierae TaxID=2945102 RepID=A0A9X2D8U8_9ACTN|nr:hypothetical protein [Nocardioides bruguierae]MCM0621480.1 hypothetical protein [Nocardioides bruguierae]
MISLGSNAGGRPVRGRGTGPRRTDLPGDTWFPAPAADPQETAGAAVPTTTADPPGLESTDVSGEAEALSLRVRRSGHGWLVEIPGAGVRLPAGDAAAVGSAVAHVLAGALENGESDTAELVLTFGTPASA